MATFLVKVYNRFPHVFEGMYDSRPFKLPPHSESPVTYEMAIASVKQSVYKWHEDGSYECGVVPEGDESWGVDLQEEDLNTGDPVSDHEFELPTSEAFAIKVPQNDTKPIPRKRPTDIKVGGMIQ